MLKHWLNILWPMGLALIGIFIIDQAIKEWVLLSAIDKYGLRVTMTDGLYRLLEGSCISLDLVFNKGVAFSMFAFLKEWLKWIQLALISSVVVYVVHLNSRVYAVPVGFLVGAGLSNIYDRFIHGGVVDYVHWHCGFEFAIFNFADVVIDIAVVWLLWINWKSEKAKRESPVNDSL